MPIESDNPEQRWYLPSWGDRLLLMRWRLVYFLPLVVLLPVTIVLPFTILLWWKLIFIAVALPLVAAMNAAKHAIRLRTEPFCIHCGYDLTGLPEDHRCPECGVPFSLHDIDDYRRDPHWFIQRQKLQKRLPPADAAFHAGPHPSHPDGTQ